MPSPKPKVRTEPLLAACALLALGGCWFASARSGGAIEHERAGRIVPGKTTKLELLQWFGPPVAVLHRGATVTLPPVGVKPQGWREVQADAFFELFSVRLPPAPDDVLYYYASAEQKEFGVFLLVAGHVSSDVDVSQLWILLDGARGVVKDVVFRQGGETLAPPPAASASP